MPLPISFYYRLARLLPGMLATTGCAVYAPLQPTMPLLRAPRQAEAMGNVQPIGRVEATAVVTPVGHLLLTASGSYCPKITEAYYLTSRQYEVAGGGYLPFGKNLLLNGLVGYGQAVNTRGYLEGTISEYQARYDKLFVQAGFAELSPRSSIGLTYRLAEVRFATLNDNFWGPLPLRSMLRHKFLFFARDNWFRRTQTDWETLATIGFSAASSAQIGEDQGQPYYQQSMFDVKQNLFPGLFLSFGLVYTPHRKPVPAPEQQGR